MQYIKLKRNKMNYPAASYGVSKAPIRNGPFAASCGELTRMRLKGEDDYEKISREGFCVSGHENFISVLACLDSIRMNRVSD
jgi:hypothetical protein